VRTTQNVHYLVPAHLPSKDLREGPGAACGQLCDGCISNASQWTPRSSWLCPVHATQVLHLQPLLTSQEKISEKAQVLPVVSLLFDAQALTACQ
jgi:hypothetical protein